MNKLPCKSVDVLESMKSGTVIGVVAMVLVFIGITYGFFRFVYP